MQACPDCGKEVKYIATGFNSVAMVDVAKVEIVTENGHKIKGYLPHKCKGEEIKDNG